MVSEEVSKVYTGISDFSNYSHISEKTVPSLSSPKSPTGKFLFPVLILRKEARYPQ
jgi:hypothetical protein